MFRNEKEFNAPCSLKKRTQSLYWGLVLLFLTSCSFSASIESLSLSPLKISVHEAELNNGSLESKIEIQALQDIPDYVGKVPQLSVESVSPLGLWNKVQTVLGFQVHALAVTNTCDVFDVQGKSECIVAADPGTGEVELSLTTEGEEPITLRLNVIFYPAPTLTSVAPNKVGYKSQETIEIEGENLRPGVRVFFQRLTDTDTWSSCHSLSLHQSLISATSTVNCQMPLLSMADIGFVRLWVVNTDRQEILSETLLEIVDKTAPIVDFKSLAGFDYDNIEGQLFQGGTNGQTVRVIWRAEDEALGATPVTLRYSVNGTTWVTIATDIVSTSGADAYYDWKIPSINSSQARLQVRVQDESGNVTAVNSPYFAVDSSPPQLILSSLNGGQLFKKDQQTEITWTATDAHFGTQPIELQYSVDGTTWTDIASDTGNSGSFLWTIPDVSSNTVWVKVTATDILNQSTSVTSLLPFAIDSSAPTLNLTSLQGGQSVAYGLERQITWTASDTNFGTTPISIAYSADGGGTWQPIVSDIENSGVYDWTVNVPVGSTYRIQITAVDKVGNTTTVNSSSDFAVTADLPYLSQTQTSPVITGAGVPVSFGGECDRSANMGGSPSISVKENGVWLADISCTDNGGGDVGEWSYSVPPQSTDAERVYTFTQTNLAALSNSIDAVWIRDTLPPAITQVQINNGAPYISTTMISVSVTASDAVSGENDLQVKLKAVDGSATDCQALYTDDGWNEQNNPTASYFLSVSDDDQGTNAVKKVCAWAKDKVGNITVLSPPEGTLGQNMDTITLVSSSPPVISSFSVSNAATGTSDFDPGDLVRIAWTIHDDVGLESRPVTIEYTNDNGKNWNVVETAYGSVVGNAQDYSDEYLGMVAPIGIFRIRIRARSISGLTSSLVSPTQASSPWSVYMGSSDRGFGGTAKGASIYKGGGARHSFDIDPATGDLYVFDEFNSGLLKVDARTNIVSVFIAAGTMNLPDSGNLGSGSRIPANIGQVFFDRNGLMYLIIGNASRTVNSATIYQVNLKTKAIRRYLGGPGAVGTGDTSTPWDTFVVSAGIAFDEDNSLYFISACSPGSAYNSSASSRMLKVTQNSDGTAGTISKVVGNCAQGFPVSGELAVNQPLSQNGENLYYSIAAWNHGQTIYYTLSNGSASAKVRKILNGIIYDTTIPTSVSLTYDNKNNKLHVVDYANTTIKEFTPNLLGDNGEGSGVMISNGNGNGAHCNSDGADRANNCMRYFGGLAYSPDGQLFFGIGGTGTLIRIAYVNVNDKVRIYAGTLPFSGEGLSKELVRGDIAGIYYKHANEPKLGAFPEGLYFISHQASIFGRVEADNTVTVLAGGEQKMSKLNPSDLVSLTRDQELGQSTNSGRMTFDEDGLPWMVVETAIVSVDENYNFIKRQSGSGSVWDYAELTDTAQSTSASGNIQGQNLTLKKQTAFVGGRTKNSALTLTNPVLRALDFTANTIAQIMGTSISQYSADSPTGVRGDVGSKSFTKEVVNTDSYTLPLQFAENNPAVTTDDVLYMAELNQLRLIEDPTTPSNTHLRTLFTTSTNITNFIMSIDPVTLKPDNKRIYYIRSGRLYCYAMESQYEGSLCKHTADKDAPIADVSLGPPTGMDTISTRANQMTWKDERTLLIVAGGSEVYQFIVTDVP